MADSDIWLRAPLNKAIVVLVTFRLDILLQAKRSYFFSYGKLIY